MKEAKVGTSRWQFLGLVSACLVVVAMGVSAAAIYSLSGLLEHPTSMTPIARAVAAIAAGALANLVGQSLACVGLCFSGRCRWWSAFAILAGIGSLVAELAVTLALFWRGGFLLAK